MVLPRLMDQTPGGRKMKRLGPYAVAQLLRNIIKTLGSGTYGTFVLVDWHREPAALKVANSASTSSSFTCNTRILSTLKGAGGTSLLLGVAHESQALLTNYKGSKNLEHI